MKIFVNIAQMFVGHMSVYLGGGDIGVAKHGLNTAQIRTIT